jgi:hypothetical protein
MDSVVVVQNLPLELHALVGTVVRMFRLDRVSELGIFCALLHQFSGLANTIAVMGQEMELYEREVSLLGNKIFLCLSDDPSVRLLLLPKRKLGPVLRVWIIPKVAIFSQLLGHFGLQGGSRSPGLLVYSKGLENVLVQVEFLQVLLHISQGFVRVSSILSHEAEVTESANAYKCPVEYLLVPFLRGMKRCCESGENDPADVPHVFALELADLTVRFVWVAKPWVRRNACPNLVKNLPKAIALEEEFQPAHNMFEHPEENHVEIIRSMQVIRIDEGNVPEDVG